MSSEFGPMSDNNGYTLSFMNTSGMGHSSSGYGSVNSMSSTQHADVFDDATGILGHEEAIDNLEVESYSINDEVFLKNYQYSNDMSNEQNNDDALSHISSESSLRNVSRMNSTPQTSPEFVSSGSKRNSLGLAPTNTLNMAFQQAPATSPGYSSTFVPSHNAKQHSTSSLPIDQLNLLSIQSVGASQSSKSPSPDYYTNVYQFDNVESKTVNPRELFTGNKIPVSYSSPSLSTLFKYENDLKFNNYTTDKVSKPDKPSLPGSFSNGGSFSDKTTLEKDKEFKSPGDTKMPFIDFKMNDECFNAISYWINNTMQTVGNDEDADVTAAEIMNNPTGIMKSNIYHKRRNSIQVSYPSTYNKSKEEHLPLTVSLPSSQVTSNAAGQKKKRRKSCNTYDMPSTSSIDIRSTRSSMGVANLAKVKLESSNGAYQSSLPNGSYKQKQISPIKSAKSSPATTPKIQQKDKFSESPSHAEDDTPTFPCPNCDKQFKRSEHLKRHHRSVHSNIRPFHCKYCEKKFSRSDNLAQHLKTHYKMNSNGTTTVIYGNPNVHNRKKKD